MVEKNILWFFLLFLIFYSKYYKYVLSVYVFVYAWFSGNNFQCSPEFKFVEFKFVFDIRITHTMHREREEEGGIDIVFSLNILLCLPYICTILFSKRNFHGGRMIGCYIMFIKNFKFTMILKLFIRPENYVVILNHV